MSLSMSVKAQAVTQDCTIEQHLTIIIDLFLYSGHAESFIELFTTLLLSQIGSFRFGRRTDTRTVEWHFELCAHASTLSPVDPLDSTTHKWPDNCCGEDSNNAQKAWQLSWRGRQHLCYTILGSTCRPNQKLPIIVTATAGSTLHLESGEMFWSVYGQKVWHKYQVLVSIYGVQVKIYNYHYVTVLYIFHSVTTSVRDENVQLVKLHRKRGYKPPLYMQWQHQHQKCFFWGQDKLLGGGAKK